MMNTKTKNKFQHRREQSMCVFLFVGAIIIVSSLFFQVETARALSWHQTATVVSGDVKDTSTAIASDGTLGMAWYDTSAKALQYASCRNNCAADAGNWTVETVDDDTNADYDSGEHPVLAFNGTTPGILYYQRTDVAGTFVNDIRYAVRDNSGRGGCGNNATSAWACELADTSGISGDGTYFSLTYDGAGQAQAAWTIFANGLQYATRDDDGTRCQGSTKWRCTTASVEIARQSPTIVAGAGNKLFSVFKSSDGLKLSSCTAGNCTQSGSWNTIAISNNTSIGAFSDMKLRDTAMHIAAYDSTIGDIVYFGCANDCTVAGNWSGRVFVDENADQFSGELSLALTDSGNPRIAYYKSNAIWYASCNGACTDQNSWSLKEGPSAKRSRPGLTIDANGDANVSFSRSYGSIAYARSAANTPPTVSNVQTSGTGLGQATNGSGYVTFSFQANDDDGNPLKAKIEYSDNNGTTWYKPMLVSSNSVDNNRTYQIDPIVAGATVSAIVDTKNSANGHGAMTTVDGSQIKMRIVVNDGVDDILDMPFAWLSVDNTAPTTFGSSFVAGTPTAFSMPLTWTAVQDDRFDRYSVWYGKDESGVINRNGTAKQWTVADDPNFTNRMTTGTTITGLTVGTKYYFRIWALDMLGNETAAGSISATTAATTGGRIEKTWTFSDNKTAVAQIFSRTDQAYKNYIAYIETQCRQIVKSRFVWSSNYEDGSSTNWQNFGIPDCSGTQTVQPGVQSTQQLNQPVSTTVQHVWFFSDTTSTNASILSRNDSEYLDFISSVDLQCSKITKSQWEKGSQWKQGAADSSAVNWKNFGIPDCSGVATTVPPQPTPVPLSQPTSTSIPTSIPIPTSLPPIGQWNDFGAAGIY